VTGQRVVCRRCGALVALLVVLGVAASIPVAPEPAEGARQELMREIVDEQNVVTARDASPLAYLGHVYETLLDRLLTRFSESPAMLAASRIVVWVVVILAAGVLAWGIASAVHGALRGRVAKEDRGAAFEREVPAEEDPRAAFESALGRQDAGAALHALWRWTVTELGVRGGDRIQDGATYREILQRARGSGTDGETLTALGRLARASERWLYRGEPFALEDVLAMREALGGWLR
jgi:hypothetical protein